MCIVSGPRKYPFARNNGKKVDSCRYFDLKERKKLVPAAIFHMAGG